MRSAGRARVRAGPCRHRVYDVEVADRAPKMSEVPKVARQTCWGCQACYPHRGARSSQWPSDAGHPSSAYRCSCLPATRSASERGRLTSTRRAVSALFARVNHRTRGRVD